MPRKKVELAVKFSSLDFEEAVKFFEDDPSCEYAPERIAKEWSACYFEVSSEKEADNLEFDLYQALLHAGFDNFRFELEGDFE